MGSFGERSGRERHVRDEGTLGREWGQRLGRVNIGLPYHLEGSNWQWCRLELEVPGRNPGGGASSHWYSIVQNESQVYLSIYLSIYKCPHRHAFCSPRAC